MATYGDQDKRSIGDLFSSLTTEVTTLFQKEVALAKSETADKIHEATVSLAMIIGAALLGFAGLIILLDAIVFLIAEALPHSLSPWLAALIVGGITIFIAFLIYKKGKDDLSAKNLQPSRTMDSLRKDKDMLKEQVT